MMYNITLQTLKSTSLAKSNITITIPTQFELQIINNLND